MNNQLITAHYDAQALSEDSQYEDNPHIFNNYFEYLLSIIGFAVGYGSFWRFPYLIYKNGGGVFLIPYFFALFVLGIPILYLQTAIGQMHRKSIPFILQKINKGLKIVGITYLCSCFHLTGYYNIILTYSYRFIFSAFNYNLPFANQSPISNHYFSEVVLHKSKSINDFQSINPFLFILYVFSLYVCYLIVRKGVKSSGKIVVFTAILPYIFFLILFFRGIFLEGAGKGVAYLFQPKWSKLFGIQIWIDAIVQVFYQMTIAMGGLIHLASMKPKRQKFLTATYLIPGSLVLCGMLSALNVFMYLGHFTNQLGLQINDLQLSGPQLSFNIFPKALAILPFPNFWILLFFVAMIFLGIDSQFGYIQTIFCYLKDQFSKGSITFLGKQITFERAKQMVIVFALIFAPSLTSCAGIYYLEFYDSFTCTVPFSLGALIELYIFVYFIPFAQLQNKVFKNTGERVPHWIKWLLEGKLLLCVLLLNFGFACLNQFFFFFKYSFGFYLFGWFISSYPYIWAYIYYLRNKQQKFHLTFFQLKQRKYLHQ